MATAKPVKLFRVVSPFISYEDGREVPYLVSRDIYTADHPAVKANPGAFEEVIPHGPARGGVFEATANPGELR